MATKLYPPVIEGVLPAFCLEYDAVSKSVLKGCQIKVPFSSNASVSNTQFKGFSLRIRTASSGSYVIPPVFSDTYEMVGSGGEVTFTLSKKQASLLNEGQYYKIQIAYCIEKVADSAMNISGTNIGYYSTVGVAKCTSKATVTMKGLDSSNINSFNNEFFGIYDLEGCNDKTEKVYSYEFRIYDENDEIFYTSGEKLHQAYYDTDYVSSIDRITVNDFASTETIYSIQYIVTTINGLVLSSPKYKISSQFLVSPTSIIEILPEADEEHGVITIKFRGETDPTHSHYYILNTDIINNMLIDEETNQPMKDSIKQTIVSVTESAIQNLSSQGKLEYLRTHTLYLHKLQHGQYFVFLGNKIKGMYYCALDNTYYLSNMVEGYTDEEIQANKDYWREHSPGFSSYEKLIEGKDMVSTLNQQEAIDKFINVADLKILSSVEQERRYFGNYLLSRSSDADNYATWFNIARFKLDSQKPSDIVIKDVTIEHGRKYKYAIQQYNIWGIYSSRIVSDIFEASFEDAFLYDGEKSLRIRYNPTVDSFKTTVLEQKTDTIGGKYPFITRNGATYYKEFPLGGLLAQEIDDWHQFVDPKLGDSHRHTTMAVEAGLNETALLNPHDFSDTTIALERDFKLKVLDWLNNGKPKLFKSPYEGNYIVRLMNISLSPVKELGRMLHSFTSQAYEIAECSYENLVHYGFIKTDIPTDVVGLWRSYNLGDESQIDKNGDIIIEFESGGIQSFTVQDMMPGDMIYLTFADNPNEELPVMIGITGSYTYESNSKVLTKIRIPTLNEDKKPLDHKIVGVINVFYEGMRITEFDGITNMLLKTVVSQQYIGVSPWMQFMKKLDWESKIGQSYSNAVFPSWYNELQNYNFRTYLEDYLTAIIYNGQASSYTISEEFIKLVESFDPGEILDRINLTIDNGKRYKTELLNLEMIRFRERPVIPVYTNYNSTRNDELYIPGVYQSLLVEKSKPKNAEVFLVATSPYGYPHPIEELAEFEMIDPFAIYKVLYYNHDVEQWTPITGKDYPYYDPYYRTWCSEDYDPTVKMNYTWTPVIALERYNSIDDIFEPEVNDVIELENNKLKLKTDSDEYLSLIGTDWMYLATDQEYLMLKPAARKAYRNSLINKSNKQKRDNGEWVGQAVDENAIYDYELQLEYTEYDKDDIEHLKGINHYFIQDKRQKYIIENSKYDLYDMINNSYYACGTNNIEFNKVYWFKKYDIFLNMTTEKVVEYKNISPMNSYHIGNGVVAEATFQIRVIDYYTETYDQEVASAKAAYLKAKEFYTTLMKTYNTIARAELEWQRNRAFMELYQRLIDGKKKEMPMDSEDIKLILSVLGKEGNKKDLALLNFYKVTTINSALNQDIIDQLVTYKKSHLDENDMLTAFGRIEVYQYSEQSETTDTTIYYVLDNSLDFYDRKGTDNERFLVEENYDKVYYYKRFADGKIYFYKVNSKNEDHKIENINQVIIYEPNTAIDQNPFRIAQKNAILNDANEIQELTLVDEIPLTTVTYVVLNEEQKAALEIEERTLDIEFYWNAGKLQEETEIANIIDTEGEYSDKDISGVAEKRQITHEYIEKTKADIAEIKALIDSYVMEYTLAYQAMENDVEIYNKKVYEDWCARAIAELLEVGYTTSDLKTIFGDVQEATDAVNITDSYYNTKRRLNSCEALLEASAGDQQLITPSEGIQDSLPDDENYDKEIENGILLTRGQALFKLMVSNIGLREAIDLMYGETTYNTTDKLDNLTTIHNRYEEILPNILDENNIVDRRYVNGLVAYLNSLVEEYSETYSKEKTNALNHSPNKENLAILYNNYYDIIFAKRVLTSGTSSKCIQDIMNSITILELNGTPHSYKVSPIIIYLSQEEFNSIFGEWLEEVNTLISQGNLTDPYYSRDENIKAEINGLEPETHTKLIALFDQASYYYREKDGLDGHLPSNAIVPIVYENPISYFIFNPMGDRIFDMNQLVKEEDLDEFGYTYFIPLKRKSRYTETENKLSAFYNMTLFILSDSETQDATLTYYTYNTTEGIYEEVTFNEQHPYEKNVYYIENPDYNITKWRDIVEKWYNSEDGRIWIENHLKNLYLISTDDNGSITNIIRYVFPYQSKETAEKFADRFFGYDRNHVLNGEEQKIGKLYILDDLVSVDGKYALYCKMISNYDSESIEYTNNDADYTYVLVYGSDQTFPSITNNNTGYTAWIINNLIPKNTVIDKFSAISKQTVSLYKIKAKYIPSTVDPETGIESMADYSLEQYKLGTWTFDFTSEQADNINNIAVNEIKLLSDNNVIVEFYNFTKTLDDSNQLIINCYNKDIWDSESFDINQKKRILTLNKKLLSLILQILEKLVSSTGYNLEEQLSTLHDTYYCLTGENDNEERNLFKLRKALFKNIILSENEVIGSIGAILNYVRNTKTDIGKLISKYNETASPEKREEPFSTRKLELEYTPESYLSEHSENDLPLLQNIILTKWAKSLIEYLIPYAFTTSNNEDMSILDNLNPYDFNNYENYLLAINNFFNNYANQIEEVKKYNNWTQDIFLDPKELDLITRVKQETNPAELEHYGLYWSYLQLYQRLKLPPLEQLLKEEETLGKIYDDQYDDYTNKLNEYKDQYDFYRSLYQSFSGTPAMEFYNILKESNTKEADQKIQEYKADVQEAWWKFLNLLDSRYKKEKERGMYV